MPSINLCVIAMAPNYWGKGPTIEEAVRECKAAGYCDKRKPRLYASDPEFSINEVDGGISTPKDSPIGAQLISWGGYPSTK